MAVAVKNASEETAQKPADRLPTASLAGAGYVLASLWLVFYGLTGFWWRNFEPNFNTVALLLTAMTASFVGLAVLGKRLMGPEPPPGLGAGIGLGAVGAVAIFMLTLNVGWVLENWLPKYSVIGLALTLGVGLGLAVLLVRSYFRPRSAEFLTAVEEQGWFNLKSYKKSQGLRVRRGTIAGVLLIAGAGVWTLWSHHTLDSYARHWVVTLPFRSEQLLLLGDVRFSVPLLLTIASLWFAYRLVNWPPFADFLIATEAELNKVSWASRRRLVQDTIVVLVTVVIMTFFLLVVDTVWGWVLSRHPVPGVLPKSKSADLEEKKAKAETEFKEGKIDAEALKRRLQELESQKKGTTEDQQPW